MRALYTEKINFNDDFYFSKNLNITNIVIIRAFFNTFAEYNTI